MNRKLLALGVITGVMSAQPAFAWTGDAELGASLTSGNTENTNVIAKLDVDTAANSWRHNLFGDIYYAEDDNLKSAERYSAGYKPRYFFTAQDYLFGLVRYDQDKFSFIDDRWTEVLGYGHLFLNSTAHYLDGEIGVGARQSTYVVDPSTANLSEDETIGFLGAKYVGRISNTARFSEIVRVEAGEDNTFVESITGLGMTVTDTVSAKLTYTVRHNSDVVGVKGEKTDSVTGVNLVYSF